MSRFGIVSLSTKSKRLLSNLSQSLSAVKAQAGQLSDGREKSLFLTQLELAELWAFKSVSESQINSDEAQTYDAAPITLGAIIFVNGEECAVTGVNADGSVTAEPTRPRPVSQPVSASETPAAETPLESGAAVSEPVSNSVLPAEGEPLSGKPDPAALNLDSATHDPVPYSGVDAPASAPEPAAVPEGSSAAPAVEPSAEDSALSPELSPEEPAPAAKKKTTKKKTGV